MKKIIIIWKILAELCDIFWNIFKILMKFMRKFRALETYKIRSKRSWIFSEFWLGNANSNKN